MIKIVDANINFIREPLKAPFGFKGKSVEELWQSVVMLKSESGQRGIGLGVQSPLWSDSGVFAECGELNSNSLMLLLTGYALRIVRGKSFETPIDLLDATIPEVWEYGRKITGREHLRETFVLNSLVPVDNAAWLLYAAEHGIERFDDMMPYEYREAMSTRHGQLAGIPLITYGMTDEDIAAHINEGSFFLKIKIGNDPNRDGDPVKMLEWDKKRLLEIHRTVRDIPAPYAENGHIPYYLDANGRYDNKDRLLGLIDYADRIGALDRIILLEEPFSEDCRADVSDIPVRLAADESAHTDRDTLERIEMGYRAIALKPIAKTLSMTLRILKVAHERSIPCFCADLTVNPVMVDWNKNLAARIATLPGMKIGILESNGHQNYLNWNKMKESHPCYGASWMNMDKGVFNLDAGFYEKSGGIFKESEYYKLAIV